MSDLTVHVSKIINAPMAALFDAWLDPIVLAKFMLPMAAMECPQVENDAREGGAFTIVMQVGDKKIPHTGKYLTIDRPKTLAFTWESPESVDDSVVTLTFTQLDNNQTNIELTHVRFIDEQRRSNHEGGWSHILSKLSEVVQF